MSKRDELAPFERRQARKWTRVSDYLPAAEVTADVPIGPQRRGQQRSRSGRRGRFGALFPVAALLLGTAALWSSGALHSGNGANGSSPADRTASSRGLVFGLCTQGGLTNCVASGESFYFAGKSVRIAGIEAPQPYGASCAREAELGHRAMLMLQQLLNSGTVTMVRVAQDLDRYGLLLRDVRVGGKPVAETLTAAGLARPYDGTPKSWC